MSRFVIVNKGRACQRFHLPEPRLTQRQLARAQDYYWPGNIRELQNVIERALIVSPGGAALEFDLPKATPTAALWLRRRASTPTSFPKPNGSGGSAPI